MADLLVQNGAPLHWTGMEALLRNLAGVCESDKLGDPSVIEGLEWAPPQDIVPRNVLRMVMRDAKRRKELKGSKSVSNKKAASDAPKNGQAGAGNK